jgi:hypothetical protein
MSDETEGGPLFHLVNGGRDRSIPYLLALAEQDEAFEPVEPECLI